MAASWSFAFSLLASSRGGTGRPITAGYPATTATSLASVGTGLPPGSHGILGFVTDVPGEDRALDHVRWTDDPDPTDAPYQRSLGERRADALDDLCRSSLDPDDSRWGSPGQEAFGLVPLKGMGAIVPTVINPETRDKSDPLGQRGYVGWKAWFNAVILNQTWIYRIEAAATAL